jgi:hypothetical protein
MGKDATHRVRDVSPAALLAVVLVITQQEASAGAWTLDRGHVQAFTGATSSQAARRFDHASRATEKVVFNKLSIQNWTEYGLTDAVTLFTAPEYVIAHADMNGEGVGYSEATSIEAGARVLLLSHIGMFSIQVSGKTAGAFAMSTSAGGQSGRQIELRLLYGDNFQLLGFDGYFDLEIAERWIKRPRPNEMTADATIALWVSSTDLFQFQSYNTIAGSGSRPPYEYYRQHKLQFSVLHRLTSAWSLQSGAFISPAGQNIVQEQGFVLQLWYQY